MARAVLALGGLSLLALDACAVAPPQGPSVLALPPKGKSFEAFQQDDATCRNYAMQQTGVTAAKAANQSGIGSTLIGTGVGAGLGAALGSIAGALGPGVAIGAAAGLLGGTAIGAGNAQAAGSSVQARYDMSYTQCMYSKGDTIQGLPGGGYGYGYPGYYGYGPGYFGPGVVVGGGWGGWGGW